MALLSILQHPAAELRIKAARVTDFDAALSRLVDDMFETLYASTGIGLSANQVGKPLRIAVIDVSSERDTPEAFINPEILARRQRGMVEESCLSLPGIVENIERHIIVDARWQGRDGETFTHSFEGLRAVALQHEIDHLDGKLFIDRLGLLDRWRMKKRLNQAASRAAASATSATRSA